MKKREELGSYCSHQMRNDNLDKGDSHECEKGSNSSYHLKVQPTGFPNRLDVADEEESYIYSPTTDSLSN